MYWNVIWYRLLSSLMLSDYVLVYVGMNIYDYNKCAACSVRNVNVTVSYVSIYVMHAMYMYVMYRGKL